MAVTRAQKAEDLKELQEKLEKAQSVVFAHYIGLKVSEVSELRRKLKAAGAEMRVAKKTLIRIAAEKQGLPALDDAALPGPVACIVSYEEPTAGAQVAHAFAKTHPQVSLVGGIFDKKLLTRMQALEFARLPSKLVLLATFACMIRSPLTKFASACSSPLSGFARAMSELAKKKENQP